MTIETIFPTPIKIKDLNLDMNKLSKFCYSTKELDVGRIMSNRGGWQSNDLNISKLCEENEEFKLLTNKIIGELNHFATEIGIIAEIGISSMWINISKSGSYNVLHSHHKSIFSGCFYIKTPENCGSIRFENPIAQLMSSYLHYWDFIDTNRLDVNNQLSPEGRIFNAKENLLILFPSWILHQVETNLSDEDRISIAFNCVARQK